MFVTCTRQGDDVIHPQFWKLGPVPLSTRTQDALPGGRGRRSALPLLANHAISAGDKMPLDIIVGAQWGDEGKGRITDLLAAGADLVARYSGGDNAGHTVTGW